MSTLTSSRGIRRRRHSRGVTLIELVVTITIVSIAVTSVVGALASNAVHSADRMIQQQARAIAASYLEEIMQKSFTDPNANGEGARALFDDVRDYTGWADAGAHDQQGAAVAGLAQYQVQVQVGPGTLAGIPAARVLLITVTVTHPSGVTVLMSGYKTDHPP